MCIRAVDSRLRGNDGLKSVPFGIALKIGDGNDAVARVA